MPILPTGLTTTSRDHLFHHEAIHASLGGDDTLDQGQGGHLASHNTIHAAVGQGLPTGLTRFTREEHVIFHNTIHPQIVVGPRGTVGPNASVVAPEGFVSVSAGAGTIQAAITANGNYETGRAHPLLPVRATYVRPQLVVYDECIDRLESTYRPVGGIVALVVMDEGIGEVADCVHPARDIVVGDLPTRRGPIQDRTV